jgi:hypothetical protein
MKIISFDVGIKNMAYCILSATQEGGFSIVDWNVIALMEVASDLPICTCENPAKSKKKQPTPCHSYAHYQKDGQYYCKKHAVGSPYRIPVPEESLKVLKKKKKQELWTLCQENHLIKESENLSKEECGNRLYAFFKQRSLEPLVKQHVLSADEVNLVDIGKSLKRQLDTRESVVEDITDVVIENQISPIATRMKTIQGMLAQYFSMRFENSHIEFISSSNKLKLFRKEDKEKIEKEKPQKENLLEIPQKENLLETQETSTYRENKKDGVFYCSQILQKNPLLEQWRKCLDAKKKDDFADCFLQGLWYMHSKKTILVAEDLKINVL